MPREQRELEQFLALVGGRGPDAPVPELAGLFDPRAPIAAARAPGRLDVMGGIADYSGSLVLQLPIAEAALAAVQRAGDGVVRAVSLPPERGGTVRAVAFDAGELLRAAAEGRAALGRRLRRDPEHGWSAYVLGPVFVWASARPVDLAGGLRLCIRSHVPEGKGVSSSAAVEVAALGAAARREGDPLAGAQAARLCQIAENHVVGAPCGIMDQMTAALGRAGHLLALRCQPAEVRGFVRVPPAIRFWGIDSGIRHAVSGSDYGGVRTGAFMGYRIIAKLAGLPAEGPDAAGQVHVADGLWHGYLANITPAEYEARFAARLPERMSGAEFLKRYGGTTDPATRVDPRRSYAVRQPTCHPIYEHDRVRRFAALLDSLSEPPLETPPDAATLEAMGELMYASHASYSACGLGSDGTDLLVAMVRQAGPAGGLFGAKITGGGSGGTVAILGRAEAAATVAELARRYAEATGRPPRLFADSSDGAFVPPGPSSACSG